METDAHVAVDVPLAPLPVAPSVPRTCDDEFLMHGDFNTDFVYSGTLWDLFSDQMKGVSRVSLEYMKLRYRFTGQGQTVSVGTFMSHMKLPAELLGVAPGFYTASTPNAFFTSQNVEVDVSMTGMASRILFPATDLLTVGSLYFMCSAGVVWSLVVGVNRVGKRIIVSNIQGSTMAPKAVKKP